MVNVLLIEPNSVLAKIYSQALDHAGFKVRHAKGAQSAVNAMDQETPDVIVLELQLPAHNGIEFLQELRSYAEWQSLPVIVNTMLSPTNIAQAAPALQRDFGIKVISYKSHSSLQDLVGMVRENTLK